jgi:hypothetical protein
LLQDKLQRFQSHAARVVTGATYDVRSLDILNTLSWETLDNRRKNSKAVFMYKVLNDHAAPCLKESFYKRNVTQNTFNLRNSENDLTLPKPRTEYLRRSFKYSGAMLWNDLSSAAAKSAGRFCAIRATQTDDDKLYLSTLTLSAEAGFHNGRVKNINKLLQVK